MLDEFVGCDTVEAGIRRRLWGAEAGGAKKDILTMQWTLSDTIGLAKFSCAHCHGTGLRAGRGGKDSPCNCVFRAIFRACYNRFRECATKEKHLSKVSLERCSGRDNRYVFSRKAEDYLADFCLVSQRHLTDEEHRVFKFHFLLGADWKLCCRRLNMDRGNFFHMVYRIEQRLGRVFRELEPYGLFPLDEYFNGRIQKERRRPEVCMILPQAVRLPAA